MARPRYKEWLEPDKLTLLEAWARNGLIDEQIIKNMGIASSTFYDWKKKHPELSEALKKGKEVVDFEVENALLKRALGYEYEEVKQIIEKDDSGRDRKRIEKTSKQIAPDTTAQIFWLKNRKPDEWRNKTTKESKAEDLMLEKMASEIERLKAETDRLRSLLDPNTMGERMMSDYIGKLEEVLRSE